MSFAAKMCASDMFNKPSSRAVARNGFVDRKDDCAYHPLMGFTTLGCYKCCTDGNPRAPHDLYELVDGPSMMVRLRCRFLSTPLPSGVRCCELETRPNLVDIYRPVKALCAANLLK